MEPHLPQPEQNGAAPATPLAQRVNPVTHQADPTALQQIIDELKAEKRGLQGATCISLRD